MFKKARKYLENNMDSIAMGLAGLAVMNGSDIRPYIN